MTPVAIATSLGERFLRERTFELIVAPAIADLQHDGGPGQPTRLGGLSILAAALAWGLYEDLLSDPGELLTFAGLVLIPAGYYALLVMICAPVAGLTISMPGGRATVALAVLALSLGPALACYWPERPARRPSSEV
jgi:hypothetical protein